MRSLGLPDIEVISSGTDANTYIQRALPVSEYALKVLQRHGIVKYAKRQREQLTQDRILPDDIVICLSPRIKQECQDFVTLPPQTLTWNIVDIGESSRLIRPNHSVDQLVEDMLAEIKNQVDMLVATL